MWLRGRASPCQGEGRGFESRHPLGERFCTLSSSLNGGVAERRGSGLQSRIHGFESRLHLQDSETLSSCAIGAAVARFPDTEEVTGSIPVSRTSAHALMYQKYGYPVHLVMRESTCGCGSGVEHHLAKVRVAGSNPVIRSTQRALEFSRALFGAHSSPHTPLPHVGVIGQLVTR